MLWLDEALSIGERVDVEVLRMKKGSLEGRTLTRDEVPEAPCPHIDSCGGCPWQRLDRKAQLDALQRDIDHQLRGRTGEPLPWGDPWVSQREDDLAWRHTARFHWRDGQLGFYQRGSKTLTTIPSCLLLAAPLPALLSLLQGLCQQLPGAGVLRLSAARDAESGTITLQPEQRLGSDDLSALVEALLSSPHCHGVSLIDGRGRRLTSWGRAENQLSSAPHPAEAFMQAHQEGNEALIATVIEACDAEQGPLLDYYAGAGNFSLPLARRGHLVTAVELSSTAMRALQAQADFEGLPLTCRSSGDEQLPPGDFKQLVLDPPRAGAQRLIEALAEASPPSLRQICYVSCHPATAVRDLKRLIELGWSITTLRLFHLFPHSGHGELFIQLRR